MSRYYRSFGGIKYGFIRRCFTKSDAEKIAKTRREHGLKTRITKARVSGMRGCAYDTWGA